MSDPLFHITMQCVHETATGTCFFPLQSTSLSPLHFPSANSASLDLVRTQTESTQSQCHSAPTLWNRLPNTLQHAEGIASFRRHLKLYLFQLVSLSGLDMVLIGSPPPQSLLHPCPHSSFSSQLTIITVPSSQFPLVTIPCPQSSLSSLFHVLIFPFPHSHSSLS